MESGRFGVLLWQRDFACIPCLLRRGAEERGMEEISGVGSWECGRMGKPREKQVSGCEAVMTQTDLKNLRCHPRGDVLRHHWEPRPGPRRLSARGQPGSVVWGHLK